MKKSLAFVAVVFLAGSVPALAAEWTGRISDSMCGVKHAATEHAGTTTTEHDCVEKCVKGGASYVFVTGDKVYKIANQDYKALKTLSGQEVVLTGDMKDDTVTITKLAAAKKEKK